MSVFLRQRKQTKKGTISLFLEIYKGAAKNPEGKLIRNREYEYLKLYLIDKPRNPVDKEHNKQTIKLAEGIRDKRSLSLKNGEYGFNNEFKQDSNFIEYFRLLTDKRKESQGNYGNWDSALKHLIKFAGNKISFREVDKKFCERFKEYLTNEAETKSENKLSSSAVASYFTKLRACLNKAIDDEIIIKSPARGISTPNKIENEREYLTLDELRAVAKAECRYDVLKRAFLFSCLTGLRWSDINKLTWSELVQQTDGWRIVFHQKKTKGLQYLDITEQAMTYLGDPGEPAARVFSSLKYSAWHNMEITKWMMKAGITKNITFHCARHTFAVLQLTLGTEIYTLSKLLGHSQVKTTQAYAKIIDEKKREAVNKIPSISL
jgi:integrase